MNKPDIKILRTPVFPDRDKGIMVVAGPCSAESQDQVLETAYELAQIPEVRVFRAGIWKPRTRPNTFEGVGAEGLQWLQMVKQETGLLVAVEVATADHVEQALKYEIDILWIGARTSANPFSVQEIADALRGEDMPIWVKNPVNPDLQLWIGALERVSQAGISKLAAIHRGFTTSDNTNYRNSARWQIPIELKRHVPDIPVICDPSHLVGRPEYLQEVSQKALDLSMDGLMIETHINPEKALSDAQQQIRPATLRKLLEELQIRRSMSSGTDIELDKLREQSNAIDYEILENIARRIEIVQQIGRYKKRHDLTVLQVERWKQVIEDRLEKAKLLGLEEKFI